MVNGQKLNYPFKRKRASLHKTTIFIDPMQLVIRSKAAYCQQNLFWSMIT